jgi:hypothetical protein
MRTPLAILASLTLVGSASAQAANTDQKTVPVTGAVASLCVLGAPDAASIDVGQMAQTSGADVGKITTIAEHDVHLPASFCNYAGTALTISATALVASDTSTVQPGFTRAVNFTSTVTPWATPVATVTTGAQADGTTPTDQAAGGTLCTPKLADLTLALTSFTGGNLLLVAGGYSGSVTITLGPSASGCV